MYRTSIVSTMLYSCFVVPMLLAGRVLLSCSESCCPNTRRHINGITAGLLILAAASHPSFGFTVVGGSLQLDAPTIAETRTLEFTLDQTGNDDGMALSVGNYQVRLELFGSNAGSAVRIVDVGPTVSAIQSRILDVVTFDDTWAFAGTVNFIDPFAIADEGGLLAVTLEIQPEAVGDYSLSVMTGLGRSEFTDPGDFSSQLPFGSEDGAISIVPEPSTAFLAMCGLLLACRRRMAMRHDMHRSGIGTT